MKTLQSLHAHILAENTASILAQCKNYVMHQDAAPINIYLLANVTMQALDPVLSFYLLESNMQPKLQFAGFDNVVQEVLDENSELYANDYDLIVCALMYDEFDPAFLAKLQSPEAFIQELTQLYARLQEKTKSLLLVNTLIPAFFTEIGTNERQQNMQAIHTLNQFIRDYVNQHAQRMCLLDWTQYLQRLGEAQSLDYRYWHLFKSPFKKAFLSYYAQDITKVARIIKGHAKKCLILDCDNTLWGGVIGEDGLANIQLDPQQYPGIIYYQLQKVIVELVQRGIIIALCSKNNAEDVWQVFAEHPCCLLKREHIALAKINWNDKSNNIIELVRELNISLEHCVFLDDSSTECELVQKSLPQLTVLQVPDPIYNYPGLLLREGLFDTLSLNNEDKFRTLQYQQEALRKQALQTAINIDDYLASLQLVANIQPMHTQEINRVTQLLQKTNQFNLSNKRYTQQHIQDFLQQPDVALYRLKVKDKFGDYGLTGVCIVKRQENLGIIDSFLLSCRVLSRKLEYSFLQYCLQELTRLWNIVEWRADFKATTKNAQVRDFLTNAKFICQNEQFILPLNHWENYPTQHIKIEEVNYA